MALFKNKYRIESTRLKNWDYSNDGYYFITICTQNRNHFFGEIMDSKMQLNGIGKLAKKFWLQIPLQFDYAVLDSYVIMPNHVHGIVVIDNNDNCRGVINHASTGGVTKHHNPMLHNNVSRIIRWYKGRTTFESRKINTEFGWQSRFYDHIVRNEKSLNRIKEYIKNNPKMWHRDRNNNAGLKM